LDFHFHLCMIPSPILPLYLLVQDLIRDGSYYMYSTCIHFRVVDDFFSDKNRRIRVYAGSNFGTPRTV